MNDANHKESQAVFEAMLKMDNIDAEALQRAYNQQ